MRRIMAFLTEGRFAFLGIGTGLTLSSAFTPFVPETRTVLLLAVLFLVLYGLLHFRLEFAMAKKIRMMREAARRHDSFLGV